MTNKRTKMRTMVRTIRRRKMRKMMRTIITTKIKIMMRIIMMKKIRTIMRKMVRTLLKTTRRCGPLRGPSSSSCGGLRPMPFFALRAKKDLFMSVLAQILVIFGDQ